MKKKRAWNMSNPLYRYLHKHSKRVSTRKKTGGRMARRRFRSYAKKARSFGGGMLMRGLVPKSGATGMVTSALAGMGAASLVDKFAPNAFNGMAKHGAAFVVGGLPGAAGSLARDFLLGGSTTTTSTSFGSNYM